MDGESSLFVIRESGEVCVTTMDMYVLIVVTNKPSCQSERSQLATFREGHSSPQAGGRGQPRVPCHGKKISQYWDCRVEKCVEKRARTIGEVDFLDFFAVLDRFAAFLLNRK